MLNKIPLPLTKGLRSSGQYSSPFFRMLPSKILSTDDLIHKQHFQLCIVLTTCLLCLLLILLSRGWSLNTSASDAYSSITHYVWLLVSGVHVGFFVHNYVSLKFFGKLVISGFSSSPRASRNGWTSTSRGPATGSSASACSRRYGSSSRSSGPYEGTSAFGVYGRMVSLQRAQRIAGHIPGELRRRLHGLVRLLGRSRCYRRVYLRSLASQSHSR